MNLSSIISKVLDKKGVFLFTFSNLYRRAVNFIFVVCLARVLTLDEFGEFSSYNYLLSLVIIITNFGFNEFVLANSNTDKTLNSNFKTLFLASLSLLILIGLISLFLPLSNNLMFVLLLAKLYLDVSLSKIFLSYFQVKGYIKQLSIDYFISSSVIVVLVVICYYYKASLNSFLLASIFGSLILYILNLKYIELKSDFNLIDNAKRIGRKIKYYGLSNITVTLYMLIPNAIASFLVVNDELAIYQAAFSIANVILLVSVSYIQFSYKDLLKIKRKNQFITKLKNISKNIIAINLIIILFFAFFGKELIIFVFGTDDYLQSWPILMILLAANLLQSVSAVFLMTVVVGKLQKKKYRTNQELIVIGVVVGFVCIFYFGIYGICFTYLILYLYSLIRFFILNKKMMNNYEKYFNKDC